jgi:single-strand DNA-binding protein
MFTTMATGNVGKIDAPSVANNGKKIIRFSLAVKVNKEKTEWLKCTCYDKKADLVEQYVKVGSKLLVDGQIGASAYFNKEQEPIASLSLFVNNIEFLDSRSDQQQAPAHRSAGTLVSDDVPF